MFECHFQGDHRLVDNGKLIEPNVTVFLLTEPSNDRWQSSVFRQLTGVARQPLRYSYVTDTFDAFLFLVIRRVVSYSITIADCPTKFFTGTRKRQRYVREKRFPTGDAYTRCPGLMDPQ